MEIIKKRTEHVCDSLVNKHCGPLVVPKSIKVHLAVVCKQVLENVRVS